MCRTSCITLAALVAVAGSLAFTQPPAKDPKAAKPAPAAAQPAGKEGAQPQMSEQDMKDMQCMTEAGTPGEMHKWLAKGVGTWSGKCKMWMKEGGPAMESDCTDTVTAIMDGRYIKCEITGEMPGLPGPFKGGSVTGYDNTAKKFQSTWIDNCSTGMMTGTGELSSDQKTLSWKFDMTCPVAKKTIVMRQVEKHTSENAFTLEMWGPDPHTGKEFKCMEIAFTRKAAAVGSAK